MDEQLEAKEAVDGLEAMLKTALCLLLLALIGEG